MTTVPETIVPYPTAGYTTGNVGHEIAKAKDYNAREGRKRHVFYVMHSDYGAVADGATDDSAAINAAITAANTAGGGIVQLPPTTLAVASTVVVKSNVELRGAQGGIVSGSGVLKNGSQLLWTGAANGTVVSLVGVQNVKLSRVNVDGGQISGVTGILIDSVNSPATYYVEIENFYIQRCGTAPSGTTTAGNGYGIRVGQSPANSYQMDKVFIRIGTVYLTGTGISIESDNAMNGGVIDGVTFISGNRGIAIQACGQLRILGCIGAGTTLGPSPAMIDFTNRNNPVVIESCQAEGAGGPSVRIASTFSPTTTNAITLIGNVLGQALTLNGTDPVLAVNARCRIVTIGNFFQQNVTVTVAGTILEHSGDTFPVAGGAFVASAGTIVGPPGIKTYASAAWTPGAIAAGASVATTIGNTDCADGDIAIGSFSGITNGLVVSAFAKSGGVEARLTNATGGSITPAAGTVRVQVFRPQA